MKKLMLIVIVLVMMLSMAVVVFAGGTSSLFAIFEEKNGEPDGWGGINDLTEHFLPLNGDVGRQSYLIGFANSASLTTWEGAKSTIEYLNMDYFDTHELLIVRHSPESGLLLNYYAFYPKGTVLPSVNPLSFNQYPAKVDYLFRYYYKLAHGSSVGYYYNQWVSSYWDYSYRPSTDSEVLYYSGDFADGSMPDEGYEFSEDGDYIAPAFEFTCFGGKEPDEDGFVRATGLIVDGMDQLSLCFPYLYYKIYPGSNPLNNYELRIYEDSMFSENHTLRARITYPEMKDLEVDKTYTYIQSINTYFPIGKNTKYWLTIYDRKAGQAVYTLPVETSAMAKMQANVEHFHIYQVQDGNTVGNPDDYNYEGFFDPFDDIIGGWEPDVPEGDWNEPVPGQLDFANIGEIDEWFTKISGFSSDFVGYVSSVFTFVPAEYWVLIMIGVAIAVLLRIFGR